MLTFKCCNAKDDTNQEAEKNEPYADITVLDWPPIFPTVPQVVDASEPVSRQLPCWVKEFLFLLIH